eukprot:scaffold1058_cov362-Prasinococcus_capsulatus_cf.AAC.9
MPLLTSGPVPRASRAVGSSTPPTSGRSHRYDLRLSTPSLATHPAALTGVGNALQAGKLGEKDQRERKAKRKREIAEATLAWKKSVGRAHEEPDETMCDVFNVLRGRCLKEGCGCQVFHATMCRTQNDTRALYCRKCGCSVQDHEACGTCIFLEMWMRRGDAEPLLNEPVGGGQAVHPALKQVVDGDAQMQPIAFYIPIPIHAATDLAMLPDQKWRG